MKKILLLLSAVLLSACGLPSKVTLPDDDVLREGHRAGQALAGKPLPLERIRAGDTLRIVRNTGEAPSISAFTAGISFSALTHAFTQNDMKPMRTPWRFSNPS